MGCRFNTLSLLEKSALITLLFSEGTLSSLSGFANLEATWQDLEDKLCEIDTIDLEKENCSIT